MLVRELTRKQTFSFSLFLFFFLVTLGKYNIYIGFALKPYMIFLLLFFMVHIGTFYFQRLHLFEVAMLLFYLVYSYSGAFALYPASSIRIILGISLYISSYFMMKSIIGNSSLKLVEKILANVGILFNIMSLGLYVYGLKSMNFIFEGDSVFQYGVMLDRNYPRLIGLVQDPNFFVFYNTLFFTYFLCHATSLRNRVGLLLCILTNILTFSRGGLLAIILVFCLYIVMNDPLKKLKLVVNLVISLIVVTTIAVVLLKFDLFSILESRILDFSNDGGSGRFALWMRAWDYFSSHMIFGIGAFNFSDYNFFQYADTLTVHNTFLDILSESGLLGLFFYLLFIFLVLVQLIHQRVHKEKPYLFLAFIGYMLQMMSLSIIINDMFFLYMGILATYFHKKQVEYSNQLPKKASSIVVPLQVRANEVSSKCKGCG